MAQIKPIPRASPAPLSETLPAIIRERRLRAGLSLNQLASRAGVSRQMLGYVKRQERLPTVDVLERICGGLEISITRLIIVAQRLASAPAACRRCHYSCVVCGRLMWLNPTRDCTRPGR
jgi:transcriptional regulator with XRE-family HTH domain